MSKYLKGDKMHIFLCGSGGPINNKKRMTSCIGIIAAGQFILVDVGPGTYRNVDLMRLPVSFLSSIFLTHFHSDHIGDLGEANMMSWANGRSKPLEIYGPEGVEQVVGGFIMAYELDTGYRIAHHGADTVIPEAATPVIKSISIKDPNEKELFFDRNGLKVYAFEVDHSPVKPAFGYRFEYKGNVVVITGDTKKTENLARFCNNADILFSEAISYEMLNNTISGAVKLPDRIIKILTDIQDYHMSPVIAAGVAKEANVKKLVYVHVTPPLLTQSIEEKYLEGVRDIFRGEVVLGQDNMTFRLKPKN
ncbi:MAG: MBL fold metallo-hydrolase [Promethearchaeota archaeon]|jgi:ribonuclease Z